MDSQKLDALLSKPCIYYGFASVPKWPQKQSQSIKFKKIFWGACPQTPLVIHALCMYTSDTHVTLLLKFLATGLGTLSELPRFAWDGGNSHPIPFPYSC